MSDASYYRSDEEEDRKQVYWGAFMLGRVAFYQHRIAGYWLTDAAVTALAQHRFEAIDSGSVQAPAYPVSDSKSFTAGFCEGYSEQANCMGHEGLSLLSVPPESRA